MRLGLAHNMMIISPDRTLRDQAVDKDKTLNCLKRYGIDAKISTYNVRTVPKFARMVEDHIISITTPMAKNHLATLQHWVNHLKTVKGCPPVVYVDECHTSSEGNTWGATMEALAEAGAYVILCTATPVRADNEIIPGFKVNRVRTDRRMTTQGGYIYERDVPVYQLEAHWVTTFRDAWDENPSPLCKITRQTFEVNLEDIGERSAGAAQLSELSIADTLSCIGRVLKHPAVVRDACELLATELRNRRNRDRKTAAIVFVGIDEKREADAEDDRHAKMVKDELERRGFVGVIATSSGDNDGAKAVKRFSDGFGDVLICKQMAGRGLDIARLKVECDLSPVRTEANWTQRLMRIATRWDSTGNPADEVRTATYIGPNDCLSADLFQRLVTDQNGEIRGDGNWTIVGSTDEEKERRLANERRARSEWEVVDTALPEVFQDSDRVVAKGDFIPYLDKIFEEEPDLIAKITKPRLGVLVEKAAVQYISDRNGSNQSGFSPTGAITTGVSAEIEDRDAILESLYDGLNNSVRRLTELRLRRLPEQTRAEKGMYGSVISNVWAGFGITSKGALREITDETRLRQLIAMANREIEDLEERHDF